MIGTADRDVSATASIGDRSSISAMVPLILVPRAISEGQYWTLIFLIFPLIGLAILYAAIHRTLVWRRYGRSYVELQTLPGVVGGRLRGDVVVVGRLGRGASVALTL